MSKEPVPTFKPLATINCPHCGVFNLNWRIVCTECHKDLEAEDLPETANIGVSA